MIDLIDRRQAINACRYGNGESEIREIPSVMRWIPVSERLPEEKQSVLVWCPQYKNKYCAYLEKEQWWIFGAFNQRVPTEVIAWKDTDSAPAIIEADNTESEDKE